MSLPIHSYLRTHRRKWALTQSELAFLLGQKSSAHISRLENGKRAPNAETVLACEVLFGILPRSVFPGLYDDVERAVMSRVRELYTRIEGKKGRAASRKLELLSSILGHRDASVNQFAVV